MKKLVFNHNKQVSRSGFVRENVKNGVARAEIERFDGKSDFSIWRKRMKVIFVQTKVAKALEGEKKLSSTLSEDEGRHLGTSIPHNE